MAAARIIMFTGIIKKKGKISKIEKIDDKIYFTIQSNNFLNGVKIGDSISCDGVCLTVIKKTKDSFRVELMPETLKMTKFRNSKIGGLVNLEPALRIGGRLDGHFVMGHIDGTGVVGKIINEAGFKNLIIKAPKKLIKYLAYKGSVAVNGVSLTISGSGKDWFKVSLITHTLENTNLSKLKKGDEINIEIDMMARYLERLFKGDAPIK